MSVFRKCIKLLAAAAFIGLLTLLHNVGTDSSARAQSRARRHKEIFNTSSWSLLSRNSLKPSHRNPGDPATGAHAATFHRGVPKSIGSTYSRVVVVPCVKDDDVSWISNELPGIDAAIYVANEPMAPLHPPRNKGHEVMTYLTYIVEHYHSLPDIIIFMHAHRWTHHNLELLGHDSAEMVRRLSDDYVTREGYVNMRCQWYPGCPDWLHSGDARETLAKQEQVVLANSWHELFPSESLPEALGQACCAQFALSKERILSVPLSRFIFYRDWMLRTPLNDFVSGRIWEYLWQFLFTGNTIHCPSEEICHCLGYGICFGGSAGYKEYKELLHTKEQYDLELEDLRRTQTIAESLTPEEGKRDDFIGTQVIDNSRHSYLSDRIQSTEERIRARRIEAING